MKYIKTYEQLNESRWPENTDIILKKLQEGCALLVSKEDLEEFYKALEFYIWLDYSKIGIDESPDHLFFVLIGNKVYHTIEPKFGGEEFEVYIPKFKQTV